MANKQYRRPAAQFGSLCPPIFPAAKPPRLAASAAARSLPKPGMGQAESVSGTRQTGAVAKVKPVCYKYR